MRSHLPFCCRRAHLHRRRGGADDVGLGHVEDWNVANAGGDGQDVQQNLLGVNRGAPYGIPKEVSIAVKGGNFGWNVKEGTHCFSTANPDESPGDCPDTVGAGHPRAGDPLLDSVIEYPNHHQLDGIGSAVIGGHLYRGRALPQLSGRYVCDRSAEHEDAPDGALFVATSRKSGLWKMQELGSRRARREGSGASCSASAKIAPASCTC